MARQPAAGVVRLDQEQGLLVRRRDGLQILEEPPPIAVVEAVPVQVLEHPGHAAEALVEQGRTGRGRRGLGRAHRRRGRARGGARPGRQALHRAPGEHGLGGEAHGPVVQGVAIGQADVLEPVLDGEGRQAPRPRPADQDVPRLVRPHAGLRGAERRVAAVQRGRGAGPHRLARLDLEGEAVGGEQVQGARRFLRQPVGDDDPQARSAARLQGQQDRQQDVDVLVDVDQHQEGRRLGRGRRGGAARARLQQRPPLRGDPLRLQARRQGGLGLHRRLQPFERQAAIELQPPLPVVEHAQVGQAVDGAVRGGDHRRPLEQGGAHPLPAAGARRGARPGRRRGRPRPGRSGTAAADRRRPSPTAAAGAQSAPGRPGRRRRPRSARRRPGGPGPAGSRRRRRRCRRPPPAGGRPRPSQAVRRAGGKSSSRARITSSAARAARPETPAAPGIRR